MKVIEFQMDTAESSYMEFCTGIVQISGDYSSKMEIVDGQSKVDLKSILGLMSLCLQSGKKVKIEISGSDESVAEANIRNYVARFSC